MAQKLPTLVLVRDLIFTSRITATARAVGAVIRLVRDPRMLTDEAGGRVIVDLNEHGALDAAVAWKQSAAQGEAREIVGFVSHVDADTIAKARDAGVDRVLPRSRFVAELEEILRG